MFVQEIHSEAISWNNVCEGFGTTGKRFSDERHIPHSWCFVMLLCCWQCLAHMTGTVICWDLVQFCGHVNLGCALGIARPRLYTVPT